MLLPVKKNLNIGLGLVNSVTESELKAILAHEFGHFSQRSMKVGSFVYNVNKVIYNMLYENNSFNNLLSSLSEVHGLFSIVVYIAAAIVNVMQFILKQIYKFINKSYFKLSRQMEFHADEVAANVVGSNALSNALLKLDLAQSSYDSTINFNNDLIQKNIKPVNFFTQHKKVFNFLGKENGLQLKNDFPQVTIQDYQRFNNSKLVIKDQWASHPSTIDRVNYLNSLEITNEVESNNSAWDLFDNQEKLQIENTNVIYSEIKFEETPQILNEANYEQEFATNYANHCFPSFFNEYYDNRDYVDYKEDELIDINLVANLKENYNNETIIDVKNNNDLNVEIETLQQMQKPEVSIKTFDYDGIKYSKKDIQNLLIDLKAKQTNFLNKLTNKDKEISKYVNTKLIKTAQNSDLQIKLDEYKRAMAQAEKNNDLHQTIIENVEFISQNLQPDIIYDKFSNLKTYEYRLKNELKVLLNDKSLESYITVSLLETCQKYLNNELSYFDGQKYESEYLHILFNSLYYFNFLTLKKRFNSKKEFLTELELKENALQ
jgi:hypothetical protein